MAGARGGRQMLIGFFQGLSPAAFSLEQRAPIGRLVWLTGPWLYSALSYLRSVWWGILLISFVCVIFAGYKCACVQIVRRIGLTLAVMVGCFHCLLLGSFQFDVCFQRRCLPNIIIVYTQAFVLPRFGPQHGPCQLKILSRLLGEFPGFSVRYIALAHDDAFDHGRSHTSRAWSCLCQKRRRKVDGVACTRSVFIASTNGG